MNSMVGRAIGRIHDEERAPDEDSRQTAARLLRGADERMLAGGVEPAASGERLIARVGVRFRDGLWVDTWSYNPWR